MAERPVGLSGLSLLKYALSAGDVGCAALALFARFYVDNLAAIVRAAIRAHAMREFQFFALPAQLQRGRLQVVVRPAAITPALGMLAFW